MCNRTDILSLSRTQLCLVSTISSMGDCAELDRGGDDEYHTKSLWYDRESLRRENVSFCE